MKSDATLKGPWYFQGFRMGENDDVLGIIHGGVRLDDGSIFRDTVTVNGTGHSTLTEAIEAAVDKFIASLAPSQVSRATGMDNTQPANTILWR